RSRPVFRARCGPHLVICTVPIAARTGRKPGCGCDAQGRRKRHGSWDHSRCWRCITLGCRHGRRRAVQGRAQHIWEVKAPESVGWWSYVRTYLVSLAGILGLGFLLAVSLVINAVLAAVSGSLGGGE